MIREMETSDLEQVMKIWLDSNLDAHSFIEGRYWQSNYENVKKEITSAEVYVYEMNDEQICGFIGVVDNYIAGLFIRKDRRSKGLGKQLLDFIKDKKDTLTLQVYEQNPKAFAFYEREGFVMIAENVDQATGEKELTMSWNRTSK